jgi:Lon protease-like protein
MEGFQLLVEGLLARPNYNVQVRFPNDPVVLSFTIANLLPIENREKQRLLETTDTLERLAGLIPILEQQLLQVNKPHMKRLALADLQEWISRN